MSIKNIAVIGLGAMGTPIATFPSKAGYSVRGFDIVEKRMSSLIPLRLRPMESPKDAAKAADLVILSLPHWDIVREVVEGTEGILAALQRGQIIVDTATVPPWETKAMAGRLARKGIHWLDVPISGSSAQARVGNMVFMAGGKKSIFNKVKSVLDKVGKKTVYVGKNGDAAMLKLVVNKDLGLALESAKRLGVMLPMAGLYQQLLLNAHYSGWDQSDATVVMTIYERLAGIERKVERGAYSRRP